MFSETKLWQSVVQTSFMNDLVSQIVSAGARRSLLPQNQNFSADSMDLSQKGGEESFALYAHFPFCSSACRYCIFKKTLKTGLIESYTESIKNEVELYAAQPYIAGRKVSSLHLGGGTPSLLSPGQIGEFLEKIEKYFGFAADAQITLEANPDSLSANKALQYREAGVNRISIGVQSLSDSLLASMGRTHTGQEALNTTGSLLQAGFNNINVDLIYGFDNQPVAEFLNHVQVLKKIGVPHFSVFPLISQGKKKVSRRLQREMRAGRVQMYRELSVMLLDAGYKRYSSEDFAQAPLFESGYQKDAWQFPNKEVVALGAGSLGSLNGYYYSNIANLKKYGEAVVNGELPAARVSLASAEAQMRRKVLLGAKYNHILRSDFEGIYGVSLEKALEPLLSRFRIMGIWTVDKTGIHTTVNGLQIISEIWSELILANLAHAAHT